ncbi:MAG: hypothetical protein EBV03_06755 [Proteobacteria bacterium]|nr:hypothetical protein [Pseudomonadota bacterium]
MTTPDGNNTTPNTTTPEKDDSVDRVSSQTAGAFDTAKRAVSDAIARLSAATKGRVTTVIGADVAGKASAGSEAEVQQLLNDAARVEQDANSQAFAASAGNVVEAIVTGGASELEKDKEGANVSNTMLSYLIPTPVMSSAKAIEIFTKKDDSPVR